MTGDAESLPFVMLPKRRSRLLDGWSRHREEEQRDRVAHHRAEGEQRHHQGADVLVEVKETSPVESGADDETRGEDQPDLQGSIRPTHRAHGNDEREHHDDQSERRMQSECATTVANCPDDAASRSGEVTRWVSPRMVSRNLRVEIDDHADPGLREDGNRRSENKPPQTRRRDQAHICPTVVLI